MADPLRIFTDYLAANGLKFTAQRRMILETMFQSDEHFSAEELFNKLRNMDPTIGQATVYRTLRLLRDCGMIRELRFGNDVVRYESKRDSKHHDHLICENCGKTIEFMDESIEKLQRKLASKMDFTLTSHRMYLYGLCKECRNKKDVKAHSDD